MKENWDDCFKMVLKHEGGFVNHPKDPGGMTNLGVTKRNWEVYLNRAVTEQDMRALTPETVKPFYKTLYWDKIKGDQLPAGIDYAAYDLAVNSGVGKAAKYLQEIAGTPADGVIGPKSLEAIQSCDAAETVDALCDMRVSFLKGLSTFDTFGKGWMIRVDNVKEKATAMAEQSA
jgi:lysozyme family protein